MFNSTTQLKFAVLLLVSVATTLTAPASAATDVEYGFAYTESGMGQAYATATDAAGYLYVTGTFWEPDSSQIFLIKMDSTGGGVWTKNINIPDVSGQYTFDYNSKDIALDNAGNIYLTGAFVGTVDFDPGGGTYNETCVGNLNTFILKLDADGNFVWVETIWGTTENEGHAIDVDDSGNVYTVGYFKDIADLDLGLYPENASSAGQEDVYFLKLDASGNFVTANVYGDDYADIPNEMTLDQSGNVHITGKFQGAVDFDPGTGTDTITSAGGFDVFVQKLDSNGEFIWAKGFGDTYDDYGKGIAVDDVGNVVSAGEFAGTVDFDPGAGTANLTSAVYVGFYTENLDTYVQKLDANGNYVWAVGSNYLYNDWAYDIVLDSSGNAYIAGGRSDTTGDNLLSHPHVQMLDSLGNIVWTKEALGYGQSGMIGLALDRARNVYSVGTLAGTFDFDPGDGVAPMAPVDPNPFGIAIWKLSVIRHPVVYVDFATGSPIGSGEISDPVDSLNGGTVQVQSGGTIRLSPQSSDETGIYDRPSTLERNGGSGTVIIGQSP